MIKKVNKFALVVLCSIFSSTLAYAGIGFDDVNDPEFLGYPLCKFQTSDPDGDGWGWEKINLPYEQSCLVFYPDCKRTDSDPDGDGWGWEDLKSCKVVKVTESEEASLPGLPYVGLSVGGCQDREKCASDVNHVEVDSGAEQLAPYPLCESQALERGFAWENGQFCLARKPSRICSPNAVVTEASGWGWEGGSLCTFAWNSLNVCDDSVEDPDRDGFGGVGRVGKRCLMPPQAFNTQNLSIDKGQIIDTNGQAFVPRGVRLNLSEDQTQNSKAIQAIASTGANMLDLQITTDVTLANLESAINTALTEEMVTLVSIDIDKECNTNSNSDFTQAWRDWSAVLTKQAYQPYLLVGLTIANDCQQVMNSDLPARAPVKIVELRDAGFKMPFVADMSSITIHLQDTEFFLDQVNIDPEHNLILSLSLLSYLGRDGDISAEIAEFHSKNIPYIVSVSNASSEAGKVSNYQNSLESLQGAQRGWIAESWTGNNATQSVLIGGEGPAKVVNLSDSNISASEDSANLTVYGNEIVNGQYGIKQTSVKASSF